MRLDFFSGLIFYTLICAKDVSVFLILFKRNFDFTRGNSPSYDRELPACDVVNACVLQTIPECLLETAKINFANRPRPIYQYSNMDLGFWVKIAVFKILFLLLNSQRDLDTKKTPPNIEV